jgi:hypothetical protein
MNQFSLNNRLKFKPSGELPIILEEFMEYTSNQYGKTEGCQNSPRTLHHATDSPANAWLR